MPRYFFDTRDGPDLVRDEIGAELEGLEPARDEATRGMADLAKDARFPARSVESLRSRFAMMVTGSFSGLLFGSRLRF